MIHSRLLTFSLLVIILFTATAIRYLHLDADPPVGDISRSGVFYMDEGTYAHNVVNKILFGSWFIPNEYNAIANIPLFSLLQYLVLKVFGVSIVSMRIGAISYAMLFMIILWLLIRKMDRYGAVLVFALAGFNYFFMIYNRLALLENMLVLFLIITAVCLYQYTQHQRPGWLVTAVVIFWAGYFVKATVLFFLPLILLTIFIQPLPPQKKVRHLWLYFALSSVILIVMYVLWVQPHSFDWNYFQKRNIHRMIHSSAPFILINYGRYLFNLKLFQFMPLTYTLFLFYSMYVIIQLVEQKKLSFWDWFFPGWAICGFLFLGFFSYSPPRFSLILMPPIFVMTARLLVRMYRREIIISWRTFKVISVPLLIIIACQIVFGIFRIVQYRSVYASCWLPILSLIVIVALAWLARQPSKSRQIALILGLLIFLINGLQIVHYHLTPAYTYRDAIDDIRRIIRENEGENVLLGDIASLVAVDLHIKAVNINFRSDTESQRIIRSRPNFLILQDKKELQRLVRKLPDYLNHVELIKTYKILDNYVTNDGTYFYRIHNDDRAYQPESIGSTMHE